MKIAASVFMLILPALVYSQRVIYSMPVRVNIPSRNIEKNLPVPEIDTVDDGFTTTGFTDIIDSINRYNEKTYTFLESRIDTINSNNNAVQQIIISFKPDQFDENKISDFPSGVYTIDSSKISIFRALKIKETITYLIQKFENSLDTIIIKFKGASDVVSIRGIKYNGEFGAKIIGKYYFQGHENNVTIRSGDNIKTNHKLAFLRTYSIRKYLENNIPETKNTNLGFEHYVEVSEKKGKDYRNVTIEIVISRIIEAN